MDELSVRVSSLAPSSVHYKSYNTNLTEGRKPKTGTAAWHTRSAKMNKYSFILSFYSLGAKIKKCYNLSVEEIKLKNLQSILKQ